ncbi:Uncharacterised protein [Avibacterium paragallinarum]|uniref:Uncharacterized protein n=1 Tax=Avibacterium paragallinarum TaxID=728 RepID=A0A377IUU6_AVIPA|nr:Uncharacterised protein [Avibacterium paragallinarum]STO92044.1 Uncharacterised protein [Avibacterium paragallinarum]
MRASIQFYWGKKFTRGWRMSNNAKRNKAINGGRTAAQKFYLLWSY